MVAYSAPRADLVFRSARIHHSESQICIYTKDMDLSNPAGGRDSIP